MERVVDLFLAGRLPGMNHARHVAVAKLLKHVPHGRELMHLGLQVTATRAGVPEKYDAAVTERCWAEIDSALPEASAFADLAQVHVVIGPVGAGKSTFARSLAAETRAVRLTLDEWMARLFGADVRPTTGVVEWYLERRDRVIAQLLAVAAELVASQVPVILEIGLLQREERAAFYAHARSAGWGVVVHVLDAPREVRRERVLRRNAEQGETFSMHVPLPIFEMASDRWQPPDEPECGEHVVRFVTALE